MRQKPLLVLVGGPGGCGKSTLARVLGDELGLVHLPRDAVKAAIAVTEAQRGPDGKLVIDLDRSAMGGEFGQRAFAATYGAAASLMDAGVSIVIDQAWRRERSEPQLQPLVARGRAVQVHVSTSPELARHRARQRGDRGGLASTDDVDHAVANKWDSFGPLDLGVPTLLVDTTDGYRPSLSEIFAWVWAKTG